MFAAGAAIRLPLDPVTLSYVMALRGVRPRLPAEPFTYGEIDCGKAERLILLDVGDAGAEAGAIADGGLDLVGRVADADSEEDCQAAADLPDGFAGHDDPA